MKNLLSYGIINIQHGELRPRYKMSLATAAIHGFNSNGTRFRAEQLSIQPERVPITSRFQIYMLRPGHSMGLRPTVGA